jgi:dipeptidyl-peptidase-4
VLKQRPTLNEAKTGTQIKVIENNAALVAKLKDYNLPDKVFCSKTKNELNAWIMKPKDFEKNIRYLCINTQDQVLSK